MTANKQVSYEDAVVSIVLRNPQTIAQHEISEQWFSKWRHVIAAAKAIVADGKEVDLLSLDERINKRGLMTELHNLMTHSAGAVQNLQKYLDGLREIYQSHKIRHILTKTLAQIESGDSLTNAIGQLMQSTLSEMSTESRTYSYTIRQAMGAFLDHIDQAYDARESGGIGLKTGINNLDKVLGGMHNSDLMIVGARPGVGKTAFGLSALLHLASQGKRVGFVSTEMSAIQVMSRVTAAQTGISGHKIRDANLEETDWALMTAATNKVANLNFRINDKPNVTIVDVALQCKAWAIESGVDFIVIDYLTRVKPAKSSGNQTLDVGEVVTGCKNIARQLNIPVMVLAQLNRNVANRNDPRPRMADLRDSGIIEQEADQILLLYRDDDDDLAPAEIIVDKNRHGECATVRCRYIPQIMKWTNLQNNLDE